MLHKAQLISVVAALSLAAVSACGSKPKKDTTESTSSAGAASKQAMPTPANVQEAAGDLRDLLLTLRRVHFPYDSNKLTPPARKALEEAGEKLTGLADVHLYVEGHSDERGTEEYNIALSDGRARTVADFLISLGVETGRLHVLSMGEAAPLASGKTDLAHAKNRRVDFRLMRGDIQFVLAEGDLVDDAGGTMGDESDKGDKGDEGDEGDEDD